MAKRVRMASPFGPGACHHARSNSRIERSISVNDITVMLLRRDPSIKDPLPQAAGRNP